MIKKIFVILSIVLTSCSNLETNDNYYAIRMEKYWQIKNSIKSSDDIKTKRIKTDAATDILDNSDIERIGTLKTKCLDYNLSPTTPSMSDTWCYCFAEEVMTKLPYPDCPYEEKCLETMARLSNNAEELCNKDLKPFKNSSISDFFK